ncbi:hypothetical protein ACOME3_005370 [Neoechinorhynchus agilis]
MERQNESDTSEIPLLMDPYSYCQSEFLKTESEFNPFDQIKIEEPIFTASSIIELEQGSFNARNNAPSIPTPSPSDEQPKDQERFHIFIENVMVSFSVGRSVDVDLIAKTLDFSTCELDVNGVHHGVVNFVDPMGQIHIYPSGRALLCNSKSRRRAYMVTECFVNMLKRKLYSDISEIFEYKVINVYGRCQLSFRIKLKKLFKEIEKLKKTSNDRALTDCIYTPLVEKRLDILVGPYDTVISVYSDGNLVLKSNCAVKIGEAAQAAYPFLKRAEGAKRKSRMNRINQCS